MRTKPPINFKLLLAIEALAKKENYVPPHQIINKHNPPPWWANPERD
jgi:hypothetical protein